MRFQKAFSLTACQQSGLPRHRQIRYAQFCICPALAAVCRLRTGNDGHVWRFCGGGLAVAYQVQLRAYGLPLPACSVFISPWVDLDGIGESMTAKAHVDSIVGKEVLDWFADTYPQGLLYARYLRRPFMPIFRVCRTC